MNWKAFIIACVSAAAVSFPQNIIGCGGEMDPYDYYTTFFHPDLPTAKNYKPFYYTGYNFLYDDVEPVSTSDVFAKEWAAYCGTSVTEADAKKFVNKFAWKDLNNLYVNLEKNQPLKLPDSVKQNSMTAYFIKDKNLETLGYIMYAKQVEPFVTDVDYWNAPAKDSLKMGKLIKNGSQLLNVAKQDFIKLRYIYQIMRLAHYSGRYPEVIDWYDKTTTFPENISVIKNLCLALKAGALFRTGQQKEAAYLFSKAFSGSSAKRISNYLGFKWSVDSKAGRNEYLQRCKNNSEKAAMLALFSMGTPSLELDALKDIYKLNPACEELEVLAVREVNKLEEVYFTPTLQNEKGGKSFYFTWGEGSSTDSILNAAGKQTKGYVQFFHEAAQNNKVTNPALFETSAAYVAFITKDYKTAKKYLANVDKMDASQKVKDQCALTNLLITINEKDKIDAAFEEQLLPSIQWLEQQVKNEVPIQTGSWPITQWKTFYRSLMSEILAKRYHEQGDLAKETLAIGAADWMMKVDADDYYSSGNGVEFLRNNVESKDVEKLFALMESKQQNKFEQYLLTHNTVRKADVVDFAGTAYLREYNYAKAIEWFKKSPDKKVINKNPFIDLLYDQEEKLPVEKKITTTKLQFAEEMLRLEQQAMVSKPATQQYYKMALGLYNITYYGHTWELVKYHRGGTEGYNIPRNANAFEKEYYGCYKAKEYFEMAMNMSNDKNFKARCLFMMAKCSQKQIHQPQYNDYTGENYWDKMDADTKVYYTAFMNNQYFPQLVKEYSNTPFYKEAFNSCSYLKDFVKKK
jgi:hypothetical protein